jgi:xanthine dehydrogenase accessory factor
VPSDDLLSTTAAPAEVLREALLALERGATVALATVVERHGSAPATPGQKLALVDRGPAEPGGRFVAIGTVGGGAIERVVLDTMRALLADPASAPKLHTFRLGPSLGMCCGGSADVLVEPLRPAAAVLVVGAGHVGLSTAPILARLGFRVLLVDARDGAADPARHAGLGGARFLAAEHDDPEVLTALAARPDASFCLVMTHDHQLDQRVVEWALASGFGWVGGVGSRAKATRTRERLRAKGIAEGDVERVRMPVGIPIGARRPAEIAVSIAAELVRVRAEREGLARSRDAASGAEIGPAERAPVRLGARDVVAAPRRRASAHRDEPEPTTEQRR